MALLHNSKWKLVPLCQKYHLKTDNNRELWEAEIYKILDSMKA